MNGEEIIKYCLEKGGAYLDFPFGEGYATVKIKTSPKRNGYVFAEIFELNGEEGYIRLEITDGKGRHTVSNAYFPG